MCPRQNTLLRLGSGRSCGKRNGAYVHIVEAFLSATANCILYLLSIAPGLTSPASAPHELISTVRRVPPEERAFDCTNRESFDLVANVNAPDAVYLLDRAD